jgi:ABC-type Fe3+/spermidine/putrescine transport system ATPase subunit
MSIIKLQNIYHSYDSKEVLQDFSLDIEANKITCLLGSSGCGKTTILRLIAGLEIPQKGQVFMEERRLSDSNQIIVPSHKRNLGYVFQDLALWPHFSVFKNVAFGLEESGEKEVQHKVDEILSFFDLQEHLQKYPHQLSGGQQQMLAIARSLVMKPKVLLMDEPLANLDVKLKRRILDYIQEIKKQFEISIVYVTHDHREAFSISDQIVVMNKGEIEFQGGVEEVKSSENEFVKYFLEY